MIPQTTGIHHVTAISGEPQRNVDFYAGTLGLKLVKKTVNFDDPETYHLYYGDGAGSPGTIMTFFPWAHAPGGRIGSGQLVVTSFSIPAASLGYWTERLIERGVRFERPRDRFGDTILSFGDPDRLRMSWAGRRSGTGRALRQGLSSRYPRRRGYGPNRPSDERPSGLPEGR
jgi:glyoxalase family protein